MMTGMQSIGDVDACATTAVIGLLDALMDAMAAAEPGRSAARYAENLKRLGEEAATAAKEIDALLSIARPLSPEPVTAAA